MWESFRLLFCLPALLILCGQRHLVQARPKDVAEADQGSAPVKYVPELLLEVSLESAASPPTLNQFPYYPPSRGDESPAGGDSFQAVGSPKQPDIADPDEDYGVGKHAADATNIKQGSIKQQALGEGLSQEAIPPNEEESPRVSAYEADNVPPSTEKILMYSPSPELIDEIGDLGSRQGIKLDTRPIVFYQDHPVPSPDDAAAALLAHSKPLAAETSEADDSGFLASVLVETPPTEFKTPESESETAASQTAMEQRDADAQVIDLPPSLPLAAWDTKHESGDAASESRRNLTTHNTQVDDTTTGEEPSVDELLALWKDAATVDLDGMDAAKLEVNATQSPFAESREEIADQEDADEVPEELARKVVEMMMMSKRQTTGINEPQSASVAEPERPSVTYVVPPLPPEGRQGNSVLIGLIYQTIRVPEGMLAQMDKGSWSRADDSILDNLPFPAVAGETYISANYYYYYYYYDDDDEYGDDEYNEDDYEGEEEYDYEEYDDEEFYYDDEECDDCDEEEQNRPLEPNEEFSIITFFK